MKDQIFPERYLKKLNTLATGFTEAIDGANTDEIKAKIITAEQNIYEIDAEQDNNPKLVKAKEDLKALGGPYREAKSVETAKIKYSLFILAQRGVNL